MSAHVLHATVCIRESVGGGVIEGEMDGDRGADGGLRDGGAVGTMDSLIVGKLLGTAVGTIVSLLVSEGSRVGDPLGAAVGAVDGPQLIAPPQSTEHAERTPFVQVNSAVLFPTMHRTVHEAEDAIFVHGAQDAYLFSS